MRHKWLWAVLAASLGFVLLAVSCGFGVILGAALAGQGSDVLSAGDAVAIIPIRGTIQSGESVGGLFDGGGAYSGTVHNYLKRAQKDSSVKAIVLFVDSPGGGVTAAEEIYDEVVRTQREFNKKIVVSMDSLAASAAYYISAPADRIVAHKSTLTGSIGVISIVPNVEKLLNMLGVDVTVFKSGAHKDDLSGLRPVTEDEKTIMQGIIDEAYTQFVDIVAAGRKMDRAAVLKLADGRVYTGTQAKSNGLVDELGNLDDAVRIAGELAGIKGKPRLIEYRQRGILSGLRATLFGPSPKVSLRRILGVPDLSGLQYLYVPASADK